MIHSLLPGENKTVYVNVTVTNTTHNIYVKVDPANTISEGNESNNIAFDSILVLPDLALNSPSDIVFSDYNPSPGDEVTITAIIHNLRNISASNISVHFFDIVDENTTVQIGTNQTIDYIPPSLRDNFNHDTL